MVGPGMEPPGQGAGGTRRQKAGLDQRCRELRDLITLQEQGMRIFSQSCEEKLRLNRELLPSLQQALQEDTRVLDFVLKYNKFPTNDAFAEGQAIAAATENLEVMAGSGGHKLLVGSGALGTLGRTVHASSLLNTHMPIQEAQKRLEAVVNDQVKVCDMLLHQVKQWSQARDERQKFLQQLQEAEMDDRMQQPQFQAIRQLGNDIEKMLMKIHIGQRVTNLYLQVQDMLKNELFYAPQYLNLMCGMTVMYNEELTARQNLKAADVIRKLMAEAGPQVLMERTLRMQSLAEQRAHVKSLEEETENERQLREQVVFMLSADQDQGSSDVLVGANVEATTTKMEHEAFVNDKMEKAKAALKFSCLWDIPGSLLEQQKTLGDLEQHIQECKEQKRVLKQTLKELELKQAKLKFQEPLNTTRCVVGSRLQEEELRVNLQREEARLEQMRDQMMRNQEQLIEFENSVDNLFIRLQGIIMPGQEPPGKAMGVEEKLQQCEEKLQYLKQRVLDRPAEAQTYDKSSKTFEKVRNLLEKTTEGEKQNLKISFEDAATAVPDSLELEEEDHDYIPSRADIKKQGLQLIKANTKRKRK
ncbi:coiled-coil domain-containing protein 183 [Willisornis vidua]|uniref:Coiled-coil domain-containing protein 183 n=1 Tax=Willisornis vidua TaxID=1566151 RepID=A0ABQ9DEW9_9PASS|nr:coiled-coil domain-containing protein 183 [Willisornis vidua]